MGTESQNQSETTQPRSRPTPLPGKEAGHFPREFGDYLLLEIIHTSNMAVVYLAQRKGTQRQVALKTPIGGKLISLDIRKRFERETGIAEKLDHVGIVTLLDRGNIEDVPYFTMPYVGGRSLAVEIRGNSLNLDKRLDIFLRICRIVQVLHEQGLVHRDLKPENIMIDRHGDVRLFDFGIAKKIRESDESPTVNGQTPGTPQFMSPEQADPKRQDEVTPRSDVYSLGIMLYCLLTKEYPYSVEPAAEALNIIRQAIPPPSSRSPSLTARFDRLVSDCLSKDPAGRPQNAGEFADRLDEIIKKPNYIRRVAWLLVVTGILAWLASLTIRILNSANR